MSGGDAFEFEGRRFQLPAPVTAIDVSGERMALAYLTGGAREVRPRPDRRRDGDRAQWIYPSFGAAGARC